MSPKVWLATRAAGGTGGDGGVGGASELNRLSGQNGVGLRRGCRGDPVVCPRCAENEACLGSLKRLGEDGRSQSQCGCCD